MSELSQPDDPAEFELRQEDSFEEVGDDPVDIGLEHEDEDVTSEGYDTDGDGSEQSPEPELDLQQRMEHFYVTDRHPLAQFPPDGDPKQHDLQVVEVEPQYIGYFDIEPFTVLTGFKVLPDFNYVERAIVHALANNPEAVSVDDAIAATAVISNVSITEKIRPADFNGSIRDGQVLILPFDPQLALNQGGGALKHRIREQVQDPSLFRGVTAMYSTLLRSSTGGVGHLDVTATYHISKRRDVGSPKPFNVMRTLSSLRSARTMGEEMAFRKLESSERALSLARYAISHTYSGGTGSNSRRT